MQGHGRGVRNGLMKRAGASIAVLCLLAMSVMIAGCGGGGGEGAARRGGGAARLRNLCRNGVAGRGAHADRRQSLLRLCRGRDRGYPRRHEERGAQNDGPLKTQEQGTDRCNVITWCVITLHPPFVNS